MFNWIKYFNEVLFPKPKYMTKTRIQNLTNKLVARHLDSIDGCVSCDYYMPTIARKVITSQDVYVLKEKIAKYSF